MRKLIFFMHTSLDGFVAGPNGELNWANVDEELFETKTFSCGVIALHYETKRN